MRFLCKKEQLLSGINIVQKAMATRSPMPVLEGIYMEAAGNTLLLKCTDLALGIECSIPAEVEDGGSIVLPGRLFSELVRKLPEEDIEFIQALDKAVRINCGLSVTTLQGMDEKEFPQMPEIEGTTIKIEQKMIRDMIRQTVFATATDESKPILTGALLEIDGDKINMVAVDGYRLAIRSVTLDKTLEKMYAVVPAKSLNEVSKIFSEDEKEVSLTISPDYVLFDMENAKIYSRLLEGEFIKYRQILPEEYQTRVKISTGEIESAIERASLMAREGKNNLIKMSVEEESLIITSNSEVGDAYENISIYCEGKQLEIAFNSKYFLEVLRVLDDEEIYIDFNSNVSPCMIKPLSGEDFFYLILPVRTAS